MEAWTLHKYERPYLDARNVYLDPSTRELIVEVAGAQFVIEREGGADEELAERLRSLRDPRAAFWDDAPEGGWADLLQQMDHLGLVRDAAGGERAARAADEGRTDVALALAAATAWTLERIPADAHLPMADCLGRLLDHFEGLVWELAAEQLPDAPGPREHPRRALLPELLAGDNFYLQVAALQAFYERRSAPASLAAGFRLLHALSERLGLPPRPDTLVLAQRLNDELTGGVYASRDLRAHLDCLATFALRSALPGASRFCRAEAPSEGPTPGADFMRVVERIIAETSSAVGVPRYLQAVGAPDAPRALAQGCYLSEYYVTSRFVEILTPMLAKRLTPALRARMFKYYAEEVGHEAFEYESCTRLGLSHEQIVTGEPLPLHVAYVDLFTHLAEVDPVGYFISLFITEGLLGVTPPLDEPLRRLTGEGERFDKGAGQHAALNEEYHHTSLSRLFMADVPSISPASQRSAIAWMLLLLELNYRAWDDLLDRYAGPDPWAPKAPTARPQGDH
jgi:hypothetical protein